MNYINIIDMDKDLVSIIMPNYNGARFIGQAIDSVIAQTYENWELLITDDASNDNSVEIIKEYADKDKRIRFFVHEQRMNPANARNTAISHAGGRFFAFLDADDYWDEYKLEKQIAYMKAHDIKFCCHSYYQVDINGACNGKVVIPPEKTDYKKCLELSNPIGNLTAVYDRDALGPVYSPLIERRNDFAMWLQVLKKTEFCYGMQDVLAYYRVNVNNSVSRRKLRLIPHQWKLYHDVERLGNIQSMRLMLCWVFVKGFKSGKKMKKYEQN